MASKELEETNDKDRSASTALDLSAMLVERLGKVKALPLRPKDAALLDGLSSFSFGHNGSRKAWSIGDGPLVVLVHGYSGRGVQMATLARHLASNGLRCVFFDAGGHGASTPEKVGFFTFMNDTRDLLASIGLPVHALIGHSAGGLALMRSLELYGLSAEKYCVISTPLFPYVPLETMRASGAPEESLEYVKAVISDQFQLSWSSLAAGGSFKAEAGKDLLAIYDTLDPMVRHSDAEALADIWPNIKVVKTTGYGHNRILQAEETLSAVTDFVKL